MVESVHLSSRPTRTMLNTEGTGAACNERNTCAFPEPCGLSDGVLCLK